MGFKTFPFLLDNNFVLSVVDSSLFIKYNGLILTSILIYVDDLILTSNDVEEIHFITNALNHNFKIKNLGNLTYFLRFEVARNSTCMHLSQRKYIIDLLQETGMFNSAPIPTPMPQSSKITSSDGTILSPEDTFSYRRLIGRLIYLTNTRPDIAFTVNTLS